MKAEARDEADAALERFAALVRENAGIEPELTIRMGKTTDEIHSLIEEDQDIAILVLAAGSAKEARDRWFLPYQAAALPFRSR